LTDQPLTTSRDEPAVTSASDELHSRRVDAVRAWTTFVEQGDDARGLVRPEILRSWERSAPAVHTDVRADTTGSSS